MNDPWGSFQQFMNGFQQMAANPAQYVMKNYGIPENIASNPDAIMQQLMNSGKVSQSQYNSARRMAAAIQNNPMFSRMMKMM